MSSPASAAFLRQNERQFTASVKSLAHALGWSVYHTWLSARSDRGWPDLVLCRPPRLIVAELKSEKGVLRPEQEQWLALLRAVPGVEVYVFRPRDIETIERILR